MPTFLADVVVAAAAKVKGPGPQIDVTAPPYGALGDGATSDFTAIQAALTAVPSTGAVVFFPAGDYLLGGTGSLKYKSGTILRGVGALSILRISTGRGATDTILLEPTATGVANVVIEDLCFDQRGDSFGDSTTQYCVSVNATSDVTIRHCRFRNVRTMAVWCDSSTTPTVRHRLLDCTVEQAQSDGVSYFGDCRDFVIRGNTFRGCADDAVAVQDKASGYYPRGIVIEGNVIRDCDTSVGGSTPRGILAYGADDVTIVGNAVSKTYASGIMVSAGTRRSSNVVVSGNVVRQAGVSAAGSGVPGHGIFIYQSDHVTVSGNRVSGSRQRGIVVQECNDVNVDGNGSHLNNDSGIHLYNAVDFAITGNQCIDNGVASADGTAERNGITIQSTDAATKTQNGAISGNRCANESGANQQHGLYFVTPVSTTSTTIVAGNAFTGNAVAAVGGAPPTDLMKFPNMDGVSEQYLATALRVNTMLFQGSVTYSSMPTAAKTGNYSILTSDSIVHVDTAAGNVTITLPTAVGQRGKMYWVHKLAAANSVIFNTSSAQTINGAASGALGITSQWETWKFVSDNANWLASKEPWTLGAGGSITAREVDGTPSVAASVLEFPNGTLADQGGGVARYTPTAGGAAAAEYAGGFLLMGG